MADKKDSERQGFLSRWSELKYQQLQKDQSPEEIPADTQTNENNQEKELEKIEIERQANRERAEAIDIDALTEESDYQIFFKDGVPESLKQVALRKLWRTNPVFANLDGLNDYDENFSSTNMVLETFESAWKVGKGYLGDIKDIKVDEDHTNSIPHNETVSLEDDEKEHKDKVLIESSGDNPERNFVEEVNNSSLSEISGDNIPEDKKRHIKASHLSLRSRLKIES